MNKDQLSCYYYAGYNYDDLPFETKLLFNNLMALFEYISANRHSERVKLTKKGNLIVELPIKDRVEQCRLITKRIAANIDLD